MKYTSIYYVLPAFLFFALMFNEHSVLNSQNPTSAENIKLPKSNQVIIAYTDSINSITGNLYGIEFIDSNWVVTFDTIACSIGKNGFARPNQKKEGDGKTPSGKFAIGSAFGYDDDLHPDIDFIEINDNHYWVSDSKSPYYNKLIDFYPKGVFVEKMRRKDHLYKYGIVIEYNTAKIEKEKGSAIFIHIERKKGKPTAGCIAISEKSIKELINWLKPSKHPLIVMGNRNSLDLIEYEVKHRQK